MISLAAVTLFALADGSAGFFAASREAQTRAEKAFLETPAPERARRFLSALTEEPHVAGTPQEKKLAEYVLARFREFGVRAFLNPEGLPRRSWFRHVLIAPGTTTGYAPWPFPGLQQALEDRDAALFAAESKKVVAALRAGAQRLRAAAAFAP